MSAPGSYVRGAVAHKYSYGRLACERHGEGAKGFTEGDEPMRCLACSTGDAGLPSLGATFEDGARAQAEARAEHGIVAGDRDESWKL